MTSPGLKRPLDLEFTPHATDQTNGEGATSSLNVVMKTDLGSDAPRSPVEDATSTTKRRCTDTKSHKSPPNDPTDQMAGIQQIPANSETHSNNTSEQQPNQSLYQQQQQQQQSQLTSPSPTFKDPLNVISPLDEDINALIKDELSRNQRQRLDSNDQTQNGDEPLILTERQTHSICERLIQQREKKLREEYDRRLACKLAEQYDLFAKANYLNTFAESARAAQPALAIPPTVAPVTPTPATVAAMAAAANHSQSITNAIAAAFMQRSATNPIVSPASTPSPLPSVASSMPNLTSLAASLSANGHQGALPSTHHHQLAYNLQQQQAAAVAALRHVQQQQQQQQQQQPHQHPQNQQQQRISMSPNGPIPSGPVLLVSNLDEQLAIPEALFTLFGVFGDVIRVKILFNKKDNALIQMADANQAQVAQGFLDKQKIFGKVVRVTRSKHQVVQMPRDGTQTDAGLTKDFTNSPLHRFKIPGSRNYLNIYPPSNTLHISNIPATVDESSLHKAFTGQCGFEYSSFKFFPKDRKMALMRFNTIEQATIALIKMHNFPVSEENNLRVSFSKSAI